MTKDNDGLIEKVVNLLILGDRKGARKLIEREYGIKKSQAYERVRQIEKKWVAKTSTSDTPIDNDQYIPDHERKEYKFKVGKDNRVYTFTKEELKDLLRAYSNYDGKSTTIRDISRDFQIPREDVVKILKSLDFTRGELPVLPQEYQDQRDEDIVKDLLLSKKKSVADKFNQRFWDDLKEKAEKWESFKRNEIDPFEKFLAKWTPPNIEKEMICDSAKKRSGKVFVVGVSDWHIGAAANEKYMYNRKTWTSKDTIDCVHKYASKIVDLAKTRKYNYDKCVILSLGDIVHSASGKTSRGTELHYDLVREEQFDAAMSSMVVLVQTCLDFFGKCDVHSTHGNHFYELDMALFRALEAYFRTDHRIKFYHYSSRPSVFKEGATLFMIDHGQDPIEKSHVPSAGNKRESYIQSLLLSNPKILEGVKSRIFCQGDKHHWENIEYNDFEFIMMGTILGSDQHAAVNNWKNRSRQSCLVLDEDGLSEVLHVYFD